MMLVSSLSISSPHWSKWGRGHTSQTYHIAVGILQTVVMERLSASAARKTMEDVQGSVATNDGWFSRMDAICVPRALQRVAKEKHIGRIAGTWERIRNQDTRANDAEPVPKQELRRSVPSHRCRSGKPV